MLGGQYMKQAFRQGFGPTVRSLFFRDLIHQTGNFGSVKWLGYPDSENTWEPLSKLDNAKNLVSEFERRKKHQKETRVELDQGERAEP